MELESLKTQFNVLGWLMINMLKQEVHEHCFQMKFISPALLNTWKTKWIK
jgi:hypothetical protein